VDRLENLLNRLNVSIPGVNRAYLYFGMWKATFAWHVEVKKKKGARRNEECLHVIIHRRNV